MNRVAWFIICTVVGLELVAWALLVPSHIGTVDARVLELVGAKSVSVADEGLALVNLEKTGPARLLLETARRTGDPNVDKLATALQGFEDSQPKLKVWGASALYLERIFEKDPLPTNSPNKSMVDLLIARHSRETLIDGLRRSRRPGVLEILQTRELTNTVVFPPANTAAGQPLDATIAMTAVLFQQDHFAAPMRVSLESLVATANRGGTIEPLETVYLDLLSLGKRLNWGQLVNLLRHIPDTNALETTAALLRENEEDLPVLITAIHFMETPRPVAQYLDRFPRTGRKDLTFALRSGAAALRDLLARQQAIHYPKWRDKLVAFAPVRFAYEPLAQIAAGQPLLGFFVKYFLCLLGALLIARAVTYLSPSLVDEIVVTRPIITGPQVAIALCLLFLVLFFSETLITRATPIRDVPMHLKFHVASGPLRATIRHQVTAMIDKYSALSLLTFFIFQAIIYVFCRMKLAEIRRQSLPSRLKLRLLENEEHLFDAGLYFGFVGTVLSLILFSVGVMKPSLMAAYSSTSFGIIFVSILKIFHVRPFRRRLILDAEITDREVQSA